MATPPGKVPIAESAAAGLKFLTDDWRRLMPLSAVAGVGLVLTSAVPAPFANVAALLTWTLVNAALFRLALHKTFKGPAGISLGVEEGRLFVAAAWRFLPILAILLPLASSFILYLGKAATQAGYTLQQVLADEKIARKVATAAEPNAPLMLLIIAGLTAALWIFARSILSYPATVANQKVTVWKTFAWTKGNVFRILAALCLLGAPLWILSLMALSIVSLAVGVNLGAGQSGVLAFSPQVAIFSFANGFISAFMLWAPMVGLYAFLYKGLRPPS